MHSKSKSGSNEIEDSPHKLPKKRIKTKKKLKGGSTTESVEKSASRSPEGSIETSSKSYMRAEGRLGGPILK